ncbi:MAG: YqgE/AlgH family protein [Gammaproteobacteria bacterium]|nr:YqgE/AlgH family protein [Gammaproteobacteria bacterium]
MNLTNNLIIAMPGLADPVFEKSVSFICQHTEQGAMGLTINHPTNINFSDLLAQLDITSSVENLESIPVYLGGPVETGHGFILHSNDAALEPWTQTLKINDDISLSSSKDILIAIANGEGPSNFLITLGYAGWSKGQIEKEMKENSWLNIQADNDIIFNTPTDKRWESAAMKLGIDINLISSDIGHA